MSRIINLEKQLQSNDLQNKYIPSNKASPISGGTSDFLPDERKKASFNVKEMINILNGGKKATARKNLIRSTIKNNDYSEVYNLTRPENFKRHINEFIKVIIKYM